MQTVVVVYRNAAKKFAKNLILKDMSNDIIHKYFPPSNVMKNFHLPCIMHIILMPLYYASYSVFDERKTAN